MHLSVCLATYDRAAILRKTLESIVRQTPSFPYEVIVVDDGSPDKGKTKQACAGLANVKYIRLARGAGVRNPCVARNVAYRAARGEIIVCQSDDVLHVTPDSLERLAAELHPKTFVIATVYCLNPKGQICGEYTGANRKKPYFFLGAMYRSDLYAVGGNDEDFAKATAYDDDWFGACLTEGLKLQAVFTPNVIGHHQWHQIRNTRKMDEPNKQLWARKQADARAGKILWQAASGPWDIAAEAKSETEQVFMQIYTDGHWGTEETRSGRGSTAEATKVLREALAALFPRYGIRSLLDAPCGDCNWIFLTDFGLASYIGMDVVQSVVDKVRAQYNRPDRQFIHGDLMTAELPKADAILCRDGLVHLSLPDGQVALDNIRRSGIKYLLATTFPGRTNDASKTGDWKPRNLQAPPFNLPPPLALINEDCREYYPNFRDKSLGLWRISELPGGQPIEAVKGLTVCVDFDDVLAVTLPKNVGHFDPLLVVTTPHDKKTQALARQYGCGCHVTDAFYRQGAAFNKGAAIEEAFDILGRTGWICIWDCDIVIPRSAGLIGGRPDCLYTPARRMLADPNSYRDDLVWDTLPSPTKPEEFDGYFQLFHASAVKQMPWYTTDWVHAGGADSDFTRKFPAAKRQRPQFEVLHLGLEGVPGIQTRIGQNWRGRVSPRLDTGVAPAEAVQRVAAVCQMIEDRKQHGMAQEKLASTLPDGTLPKRMAFFWDGPMNWLRWLSLSTFRYLNPDWAIELYVPTQPCGGKTWKTDEDDDRRDHVGFDYRDRLAELDVKIMPRPLNKVMPAAHACDMFQWEFLGTRGGWYADMDMLWLASMDQPWRQAAGADAVFCLENGWMAIGLLAAMPKCKLFHELSEWVKHANNTTRYQCYGTEAIYKFVSKLVARTPRPAPPRQRRGRYVPVVLARRAAVPPINRPGDWAMVSLRRCRPKMQLVELPSACAYPFDWRQIDKIFEQALDVPSESVALHWFGGSLLARKWGRLLTENTWQAYDTTITRCMQRLPFLSTVAQV